MEPLVQQRNDGDCGVAALAFYTHRRYEDVYVAAVKQDPYSATNGLSIEDMIAIARSLGYHLKRVNYRKVDLDADVGILMVVWNDRKRHRSYGHWVVLREGTIVCPTTPVGVWDADDYLLINGGRKGTLLAKEE